MRGRDGKSINYKGTGFLAASTVQWSVSSMVLHLGIGCCVKEEDNGPTSDNLLSSLALLSPSCSYRCCWRQFLEIRT